MTLHYDAADTDVAALQARLRGAGYEPRGVPSGAP